MIAYKVIGPLVVILTTLLLWFLIDHISMGQRVRWVVKVGILVMDLVWFINYLR